MQSYDGKTYWVYIAASKLHAVLYVGKTRDPADAAAAASRAQKETGRIVG